MGVIGGNCDRGGGSSSVAVSLWCGCSLWLFVMVEAAMVKVQQAWVMFQWCGDYYKGVWIVVRML